MLRSTYESVIIASRIDEASLNIAETLIDRHGFKMTKSDASPEIYERDDHVLLLVEKECIYVEPEDIPVTGSQIIFVSKHRSSTDQPALTVHPTGNLGSEAKFGGRPGEISWVDPRAVRTALAELRRGVQASAAEIEVTMEATHHGPTSFRIPVCFIEIGSTRKEFQDKRLGEIAAKAVMAALEPTGAWVNAVGFGGTHYPAKHTKTNLEDASRFAIGHLIPKHAFEAGVAEGTIKSTFARTRGGCKTAIIDWKGLKGLHRQPLLDILSTWNVEIVRH